jgi:ATP-dependent helicase HrpA
LPDAARYARALLVRAERAALNPLKDAERARLVAPYSAALRQVQAASAKTPAAQALIEQFRWMIEEYKISVFAQELGTAFPVSPKRLDALLAAIQAA